MGGKPLGIIWHILGHKTVIRGQGFVHCLGQEGRNLLTTLLLQKVIWRAGHRVIFRGVSVLEEKPATADAVATAQVREFQQIPRPLLGQRVIKGRQPQAGYY